MVIAHCDILHWNGKKEKIAMPNLDTKIALTFADDDLSQNWNIYRERFFKEVSDDKRWNILVITANTFCRVQ